MHIDSSRQPYKVVLDSGLKFNARSVVIATGAQYARLPVEEAEAFALSRSPLLLETSVPGIFAVGDTRAGSVKRVASAVGEGAMAVHLVHRFLAESTERHTAA